MVCKRINKSNFIPRTLILVILFQFTLITSPASGSNGNSLILTKIGQTSNVEDGYDVWVDVDKNIAYVSSGYHGVVILNISTLTNPVEIARVPSAQIPERNSLGYAHQLLMHNDLLYVGDGFGGLKIINCTDPSNPEVVKQYVDGYPWSARIVGDNLFLPHGHIDFIGEITVVKITDPANPVTMKRISTAGVTSDIEIQGNLAFVTTSFAGFTVFDISNNTNPIEKGKWTGQSFNAIESGGLEVFGDLIYLSYWKNGFRILNVSDLANIEVFSEMDEYQGLFSVHIEKDRNLAFLSDHNLGLVVLDVSDPTQPIEITRYFDGGKPCMVHVMDDIVYMTDQDNGFVILKMEEDSTDNQSTSTSVSTPENTSSQSSSTSVSSPGFDLPIFMIGFVLLLIMSKRSRK